VVITSKIPHGSVEAGGVATERCSTNGRVANASSVRKERLPADSCVVVAVAAKERLKTIGRVVVAGRV
jgi:hypothetical protein